jgi:glycosyltransferase involved in cell wall biosynthesis
VSYRLVSIVLPVHRQADHIASVIEEFESRLATLGCPHETILVANGPPDGSLEACQAMAAQHAAVRAVSEPVAGWGRAVRRGLREAGGDLLCYTNSARTSAADLILLILYAIANPGVVIKANRKIRENWRRRLGSLLYNLECRALFDLSCWDINGTPKVFPRAHAPLVALTRNDDLIDLEFDVICRRAGYPMLEVPIFSYRRHGGSTTMRYRTALKLYVGAYRLWRAWPPR